MDLISIGWTITKAVWAGIALIIGLLILTSMVIKIIDTFRN